MSSRDVPVSRDRSVKVVWSVGDEDGIASKVPACFAPLASSRVQTTHALPGLSCRNTRKITVMSSLKGAKSKQCSFALWPSIYLMLP